MRSCLSIRGVRIARGIKEMLAYQRARVQISDVEICELWPEPFGQVGPGLLGHPAQITDHAAELASHLRQLVGPEYHQTKDGKHQQLRNGQVKHWQTSASRWGTRRADARRLDWIGIADTDKTPAGNVSGRPALAA